ncbi:hypothetical protein ACA910_005339 [Epithemia clementina (nom. ined.)]
MFASRRMLQSSRTQSTATSIGHAKDQRKQYLARPLSSTTENWNYLSFATPESDFCSVAVPKSIEVSSLNRNRNGLMNTSRTRTARWEKNWSHTLSFASPDSDFSTRTLFAETPTATFLPTQYWNFEPCSLSFATPESDFCSVDVPQSIDLPSLGRIPNGLMNTSGARPARWEDEWSHTLSFASPDSDYSSGVENVPLPKVRLPRTMKDALEHEYDDTALVITTATEPHEIVYVNKAWENVCGYPKEDALHQPIGRLLDGKNSKSGVGTDSVLEKVSDGNKETVEEVVLNYKATGESFWNQVQAGPLYFKENQDRDIHPLLLVSIMKAISQDDMGSHKLAKASH